MTALRDEWMMQPKETGDRMISWAQLFAAGSTIEGRGEATPRPFAAASILSGLALNKKPRRVSGFWGG